MTTDLAATIATQGRAGLVKICGLREPEHAVAAAEAGADLLGFIFVTARRQVTPDQARACIEAAKRATPHRVLLAAGVFVDAGPDEINAVVRLAGLDLVQLHGQEPPEMIGAIVAPAMKVFRPRPDDSSGGVVEAIDTYRRTGVAPAAFLIEGFSTAGHGGQGVRADWGLAAAVSRDRPVWLGGGLDPENVAAAIAAVRPLGVDVSSGVETDGVKNPERIEAFVREAREAFRAVNSHQV